MSLQLMGRKRPSKRFRFLLAVVPILLAVLVVGYIIKEGSWENARGSLLALRHLPPVLDPSTPRTQNGYTLTSIRLADANSMGYVAEVRILPPLIPKTVSGFTGSVASSGTKFFEPQNSDPRTLPQIVAYSSFQDIVPLDCQIVGDNAPDSLFVEIPGGYPNDCAYLDLILATRHGQSCHWRLTRLPPMQHILPSSPPIVQTVDAEGVTVTARAWRAMHENWLQLRPILPLNSHQWDITIAHYWPEWEPFDSVDDQGVQYLGPIQSRNGVFTGFQEGRWGGGLVTNTIPNGSYYRSGSKFLRVKGTLRQFETFDEPVVFHNIAVVGYQGQASFSLSEPQTVTTPSGIQVTLPAQNDFEIQNNSKESGIAQALSFKMTLASHYAPDALPRSPLVREFHKTILMEAKFASSLNVSRGYSEDDPTSDYTLSLSPSYPTHLKTFTVIIRQRVDLQTIPLNFTVPIDGTPPAGFR